MRRKRRVKPFKKFVPNVTYIRRADLVDDYGTPFGVFHIKEVGSNYGICMVSSEDHINKLIGNPKFEQFEQAAVTTGKVCQHCLRKYLKEEKEKKMAVIIDGKEFVKKSELDHITELYSKTCYERQILATQVLDLSNTVKVLEEHNQCNEVNQNTLNELAFLRSRVVSLEKDARSLNDMCFKVKKVITTQCESYTEYAFSVISHICVDVKPGDRLAILPKR